ncbi:flavin reductase family protein [Streptomyces hygroscopicus]|uniref:flavin reductase family protein n=1 Tax=Streptomyces hygroscopicus TaxID=1912 RepID=UPI0036C5890F
MPLVEPEEFRAALSRHPAGVVVVTAVTGEGRAALTVTSFTSASISPPLISYYVNQRSLSCRTLISAGWFAVNFLDRAQEKVATICARSGVDRFSQPEIWAQGDRGVPLLKDAPVHLVCRRRDVVEIGDHFLVVGAVQETSATEQNRPGRPLLYCDRSYAGVHV